MLSFSPLDISHKEWIDRWVMAEDSRSADFNFGNMYMWDGKYSQYVAALNLRPIIMARGDAGPIFPFPIGGGDTAAAIEAMAEYAAAHGFPLVIRGLEMRHRDTLENLFPGRFSFFADRDYFDYIYSAEKLASLSGKKMHGKRNHINRFESSFVWHSEPLSRELFSHCSELLFRWGESAGMDGDAEAERRAISRGLENFEALGLEGCVLFAEEKAIAFAIGEKISSDTFNVHFEKADGSFPGAYPMINREFARLILKNHPEIKYINREDDMGLENLRQSKLSYRPEILLEKFTARLV